MKGLKTIIFSVFTIILSSVAYAQTDSLDYSDPNEYTKLTNDFPKPTRHFIKLNLPSLAIKTFSFQYEFFPTDFLSISLAYKFTPKRGMIFKDQVTKIIKESGDYGDEVDTPVNKFLEDLTFSKSTITPEVRFYLGKGYGKGFYIGPFIRFDNAKFNSVYLFNGLTDDYNIDFEGKLSSFGYGLNFGTQYPIGKHLTLDIFIGPYLSNLKINTNSTSNYNLSEADVQSLREELEDFELPNGTTEIEVTNNSAKVKLTAKNFPNLRAGIALGLRF